jgi:hypothetical protein
VPATRCEIADAIRCRGTSVRQVLLVRARPAAISTSAISWSPTTTLEAMAAHPTLMARPSS